MLQKRTPLRPDHTDPGGPVFITLRELVEVMIRFATPFADLFPEGWVREDDPVELIALVLIVLVALALGIFWSARPTRRVAECLEMRSLHHVPMYRIVPRKQTELIPVSLDEYSMALTHYGIGLSEARQNRNPGS